MRRLAPFALLLCLFAGHAHAGAIERVLMPGAPIEGHAKYENQCDACHTKFDEKGQNRLCRDCHKPVDEDIRKQRGLHGRMGNGASAQCSGCHADHKGRKANVAPVDRETFDHGRTDFALDRAHAKLACDSCHQPGKKWRDAPAECFSCHKEDDRHQGRLGKKCADCHVSVSWRKTRFDHAKTRFPLEQAHRKASCAACHPAERYKETPRECASCHRIDDAHAGRYGTKCATCHNAIAWKKPRFDHDKTKFPLRDNHRAVACAACHPGDLYKDKAPRTCVGCHRTDDTHRGKNGTKCESCHDQKGWKKTRFDHRKTKFPLRGAHTRLGCESCHKGDVYKAKLATDCLSCHRGDDKHNGSQGQPCSSCHNETSWRERVRFDHDLTRFPLIGLHATAPCEACHLTPAYKDTPGECVRCHADDDTHKKKLGADCAACHNPNGWPVWKFDHDRQTDFRLTGRHAGLECLACHTEPMAREVERSNTCVSCHRSDDTHLGRFGAQCERCHTTKSFKEIESIH